MEIRKDIQTIPDYSRNLAATMLNNERIRAYGLTILPIHGMKRVNSIVNKVYIPLPLPCPFFLTSYQFKMLGAARTISSRDRCSTYQNPVQ
jgi:hypothetical protein